ncbi:MAG: Stp1/IreP family PP2C-type Ser/Thr phosphatase [bacterium]
MKKDKKIQILTAVYSDVGKVRQTNEDSYYVSKDETLIIVCDGMGGQIAGGLASKIAVETIKDVFYGLTADQIGKIFYDIEANLALAARLLIAAVRIANRRLYNIAAKFPKLRGMGTTVVAVTFDNSVATMVHVGDSRILRISDDNILQLTEDHSWLNELIEDNEINEEQIETFTQKNVITRALGTSPTVKIDIHCERYKKNDIYILCTDGLHNSVNNEDMKKVFQNYHHETLDTITKKLIEKANKRDGSDNITAAVAKIQQNSKNTTLMGISTTIPGEEDKIITKEDKFIQEKYKDPKLKLFNQPSMIMNQQKLLIMGLILFTAMLCFFLGMNIQSIKQNNHTKKLPLISGKNTLATDSRTSNNMSNNVLPAKVNKRNHIADRTLPIQRSRLSRDAVLVFVFFNSQEDYEKAKLEQRGLVLDKMSPYLAEEKQGSFTIFLIDSTNNVIWQTAGIQLPEF